MMKTKIIELTSLGDERGGLVVLEQNKNIPFDIKRVYYLFGTKLGVSRGFHAHKSLEQVALCIKGSCSIILDDGFKRQNVVLNTASKGIYIKNNIWREMKNFSSDCVLCVFASELYNESDYIRCYDEFKKSKEGENLDNEIK